MARGTSKNVARTATPAEVRQWAQDQGYEIGERGRISSEIAEAYNKAHRRAPFVPASELQNGGEDATLSITGMRRGRGNNGEQVLVVDVSGTLTFTVPGAA